MKRKLLIGRDSQCDIRINDDSDTSSRQHALLEVERNGKYFITDMSLNGTYINGIRIASQERVPLSRKDKVSFAHVADLDWSQVPEDRTAIKIVVIVVAALLVLGGGGYAIWHFTGKDFKKEVETQVKSAGNGGVDTTAPAGKAEKPEVKPETKPEDKKAEEVKPEEKKAEPEKKPAPKADAVKKEAPKPKAETKPKATPKPKPEPKPEETPEIINPIY